MKRSRITQELRFAVPCAFSKTGTHMVRLAIDNNGNLIVLDSECTHNTPKQQIIAARQLDGETCTAIVDWFRTSFNIWPVANIPVSVPSTASMFVGQFRKTIEDRQAERARLFKKARRIRVPLTKYDEPLLHQRIRNAFAKYLARHLVTEALPMSVTSFRAQHSKYTDIRMLFGVVISKPARRANIAVTHPHTHKFVISASAVQEVQKARFGVNSKYCHICDRDITHAVRHAATKRHAKQIKTIIDQQIDILNSNKHITSLIKHFIERQHIERANNE